MGKASDGDSAALPKRLVSKLSAVDFVNIGSSLSLRRVGVAPASGHRAGNGADLGGYGDRSRFGAVDPLKETPQKMAGARFPDGHPGDTLSDFGRFGSFGADEAQPWETYGEVEPRLSSAKSSAAGASSLPGLSLRSAGRIGTLAAAIGGSPLTSSTEVAAKGITGKVAGGPAWIGLGVVGGLVAPLLAVWRTGTMCQPIQQQVKIVWHAAAKLRPASVYIATSPLVKGGFALSGKSWRFLFSLSQACFAV